MVSVRINGKDSSLRGDGLPRLSDVIELVKASIDPEHIITGLQLDGRELGEEQWFATPTSLGSVVLEVSTDTPVRYAQDRFAEAPRIVQACFLQFRDARKTFQEGKSQLGNRKLLEAVNTLRAFFQWYSTMTMLLPEDQRSIVDIEEHVEPIIDICKKICDQQLYQSWWALGESIEKFLEPRLDKLEDVCRRGSTQLMAV